MATALSEWGAAGARSFDGRVGAIVVVDVLCFSTCVDIAVARGASVYPLRTGEAGAAALTTHALTTQALTAQGAELGGPRGSAVHQFSLSPVSLLAIEPGTRLVLPSPNGAAVSLAAAATPVLAGCLRNARAVAWRALAIARGTAAVAVIPAGERWPDGGLRPAIEDLIGAGAVLDALGLPCSPEAEVARQAFRSARSNLAGLVRGSVSGEELIARGYPGDVDAAVKLNVSDTAPLIVDGAYTG
jgi:2-phosphosulfolactate phosphatase